MGSRRLPRPPSRAIRSSDEVLEWLQFLCLNSDCRGLGGHELLGCHELLGLTLVTAMGAVTPFERARTLRNVIKAAVPPDDEPSLATLELLGLTQSTTRQPRPVRRRLAAETYGLPLNTFQKRYELLLLRDLAEVIWGLELEAQRSYA